MCSTWTLSTRLEMESAVSVSASKYSNNNNNNNDNNNDNNNTSIVTHYTSQIHVKESNRK